MERDRDRYVDGDVWKEIGIGMWREMYRCVCGERYRDRYVERER